jgi:protein ImuB
LAIATLERWGLHTLGDLARLPRADLHARLGPVGVRLHQAACGEDAAPLVPAGDAVRWMERIECDWPIEGLEPLSFVLARLCETLSVRLERADRGAVEVTTRLQLVTRAVHARTLHLPAPMRDARGIRTLMLLDLESHPPGAAIDAVEVELGVAPGRIVHGSLLERAVPAPEDLATLTARLGALMGESRIGAPALVDTHDERAVGMTAFRTSAHSASAHSASAHSAPAHPAPRTPHRAPRTAHDAQRSPLSCLRRFRIPIAARVVIEHHTPVRVIPSARGLAGGDVIACAGPWRTSGRWWALDRTRWDRDAWDVELADGGVYRLARHRATGGWEVEGMVD